MPVREMKPERTMEHDQLVTELAAEWKNAHSSSAEPIIFIERSPDGKPAHVYVIWSKWSAVDRVERSEIVMEAADKALLPAEVLNISIAMGLTADEAARLGIKV